MLTSSGTVLGATSSPVIGSNPALVAFFQPGTLGQEMTAALVFANSSPENPLPRELLPAREAFCDKFGIHPTQRGYDRFDVVARAMVEPRFTEELQKRVVDTNADKLINGFIDEGLHTVDFSALVAAGLVTHTAASNYLKSVLGAAKLTLSDENLQSSLSKIEEMDGKNKSRARILKILLLLGAITAFIGAITVDTTKGIDAYEALNHLAKWVVGGGVMVCFFSGMSLYEQPTKHDLKPNRTILQNANTALLALQRHKELLKEEPSVSR